MLSEKMTCFSDKHNCAVAIRPSPSVGSPPGPLGRERYTSHYFFTACRRLAAATLPPRTNVFDRNSGWRLSDPPLEELRVSAPWYRLRLTDPHQGWRSHALPTNERCARCERWQLGQQVPVYARHNLLEVAQVLRILKPMHDEAAALRQNCL